MLVKGSPEIKSVPNTIYAHFTVQSTGKSIRNWLTRSINQRILKSYPLAHFLLLTDWLTSCINRPVTHWLHSLTYPFIHNNSNSGTQWQLSVSPCECEDGVYVKECAYMKLWADYWIERVCVWLRVSESEWMFTWEKVSLGESVVEKEWIKGRVSENASRWMSGWSWQIMRLCGKMNGYIHGTHWELGHN